MAVSSAVRLYDNTGTLINLPGPPTPPTVRIVPPGVEQDSRDRFRMYPSRNLKPATLAEIQEEADGGNPQRWIQLCEEMVEKDPKIYSVRQTRISAILGLDYEVAPPKLAEDATQPEKDLADEIAKFFYQMLDCCNFSDLQGDVMDARFKPFAIDWIDWGEDRDGKVIAKRFRNIPTGHLKWAFNTDQVYIYNPNEFGSFSNGEVGQPVPPFQTIRALDKSNRDHPTRAGLLRSLAWPYLFKNIVVKDMVSYGDRFGMPIRLLKIDQADFDNADQYSKFRDAMRTLGSDGSGVISKNAEVEIVAAAQEGGIDVFKAQLDYFDKVIAWVVLGHELSSQSAPGSGVQNGVTPAKEVRQDILEGDCHWVAEIVKRDIFVPLVGWNWGWENVHLTPNLQHDYEPDIDLDAEANRMATVGRALPGMTFSMQQIRDMFGYQEPIDVADTLEPWVPYGLVSPGDGRTLPAQPEQERPGAGGQDQSASTDPNQPPPNDDGEEDPASVNGARAHNGTDLTAIREHPDDWSLKNGVCEWCVAQAAEKKASTKQEPVDALADRGITQGQQTSESWASQVRAVLKQSAEDGLTFAQARQKVVALYPALDVADLDTTLKQMLLLVRLHGRNA